ncbi:carbohydrate kinase family protein [Rhodovibrio salinarum]|uniref:Carbohydrate kinase family protein n=1 Tax=Rhodovibrio salinarum TaxID=1087 RepID=A0A934QG37_9PROT|nr:carbohydrate kinase family protein [Rhodovibrio salinarum]MBK1696214.1 carbohydrate kinase family protein [Rhodovibrio salinarum]
MSDPVLLCIGDIDRDVMISVPSLPTFDGKVSGRPLGEWPGGMAANVAMAATRLDTRTRLLGVVGEDATGERILAGLDRAGIDVSPCRLLPDSETFTSLVFLTDSGEKALVRVETPAFMPDPADITPEVMAGASYVHISYGAPALANAVVEAAERVGVPVSMDLELADLPSDRTDLARLLPRLDLLFVNRAMREALDDLRTPRPDGPALVTTLGAQGARYEDADGAVHQRGIATTPKDTTGAGDCFAGAFLSARMSGESPKTCLMFANAAAALSTQAYGAQAALPTRTDVAAVLARQHADTNTIT